MEHNSTAYTEISVSFYTTELLTDHWFSLHLLLKKP